MKQKKNQILTNKIAIIRSNTLDKEPNNNFYLPKKAFIMQKASINQSN